MPSKKNMEFLNNVINDKFKRVQTKKSKERLEELLSNRGIVGSILRPIRIGIEEWYSETDGRNFPKATAKVRGVREHLIKFDGKYTATRIEIDGMDENVVDFSLSQITNRIIKKKEDRIIKNLRNCIDKQQQAKRFYCNNTTQSFNDALQQCIDKIQVGTTLASGIIMGRCNEGIIRSCDLPVDFRFIYPIDDASLHFDSIRRSVFVFGNSICDSEYLGVEYIGDTDFSIDAEFNDYSFYGYHWTAVQILQFGNIAEIII